MSPVLFQEFEDSGILFRIPCLTQLLLSVNNDNKSKRSITISSVLFHFIYLFAMKEKKKEDWVF